MNTLNDQAKTLVAGLRIARQQESHQVALQRNAELFHVVGAGATISHMYEQVRNAAENTEDHLLLQRAIRRFYARVFLTSDKEFLYDTGEELLTELTLAGYLPNDTVPTTLLSTISQLAQTYHGAYVTYRHKGQTIQHAWSIDVLSIEIDHLLRERFTRDSYEQFLFDHFRHALKETKIAQKTIDFELLLFVAIHKSLLGSDSAMARWALLRRFGLTPEKSEEYQMMNEHIDGLLQAKQLVQITRIVSREGAVFRVLGRMIQLEDPALDTMEHRGKFLQSFESAVNASYEAIETRINRGVLRSIIFLIITKALIGIAIEIPYDLWVHHSIVWTVLMINLFLPPVYMLLLQFTLQLPSATNTRNLVTRIDKLLYSDEPIVYQAAKQSRQYGTVFNTLYGLVIIGMFGLVAWLLMLLGFTVVHLMIFFVFFSTASFLGFRLSRIIREYETVESQQNGIAMIRDFIYLPFVAVGQKMSESYAKFNIVANVLDMFIELPLKTVLRFVRQWGAFISSKKDEL